MPITIAELRAIVSAETSQFDSKLAKVKADTEAAGKSIGSIFDGMGAGFLKAGAVMTAAFTAPLVAVTQMGNEFETQLRRVAANTAMTDAELNKMREVVISIGRDSAAPLSDLAHGFEHAANFGFDAAASAKILDIAMQGAVTTGAKTEAVTNTLAGVLHIFGKSADEAAVTMNTLKEAAGKGNLTLEQFVSVSGRVFATAANLGLNLNEAAGAMSALTRAGFPAAQASTQLVGALNHLVNPTKEIQGELQRLSKTTGIDLVSDFSQAALQSKGFAAILGDVKKAVGDNTAEALKLFGGLRGGLGVMALIGNASEDYRNILEKLSETMAGKLTPVQDAYAREVVTLSFQLGEITNRLTLLGEELNNAFGTTPAGLLKGFADSIGAITSGLAAADPVAKKLITTLLAGFAIGGPILLGIGALITLLSGPVTIAIIGVTAGLSVLFAESIAGAKDGAAQTMNFKDTLLQLAQAFGVVLDILGVVGNTLAGLAKAAYFLATPLFELVQIIQGDFAGAWRTFSVISGKAFQDMLTSFSAAGQDLQGRWTNTLSGMVQSGFSSVGGFGAAGTAAGNAFFGNIARASQRFPIKGFGPDPASQSISNQKIQWGKPSGMSDAEKQVIIGGIELANAANKAGHAAGKSLTEGYAAGVAGGKGAMKAAHDDTLNLVNDWLSGIDAKMQVSDNVWKKLPEGIRSALKGMESAFHESQDTVKIWAATLQATTGSNVTQINAFLKSLGSTVQVTEEQLSKMATLTGPELQKFFVGIGLQIGTGSEAAQAFGNTIEMTGRQAVVSLAKQANAWATQKTASEQATAALELHRLAMERIHPPTIAFADALGDVRFATGDLVPAEKELVGVMESANAMMEAGRPAAADMSASLTTLRAAVKNLKEDIAASPFFQELKIKDEAQRAFEEVVQIIQREGERIGETQDQTNQRVLAGLTKFGAEMKAKYGLSAQEAVDAFKRQMDRLPGALDEIFNKLALGAKHQVAGVFQVIDSIPGKFGDAFRSSTNEIIKWINQIDGLLKGLQGIFGQAQTGLAGVLQSVVGIFKGTAGAASQATTHIGSVWDNVGKVVGGSIGGLGKTATSTAKTFKTGFAAMEGAMASFAASAAVTIGTGSKTMGFLTSLISATGAGVAAGLAFGPVGGAIVGGISLLGGILGMFMGKSPLQRAQEAAALQKAKDDIKISQQAVAQAFEATKQSILETANKARELLEAITFYTKVPKDAFKAFFEDLDKLMKAFAEHAKNWMTDASGKIKVFSEDMKATMEAIALAPTALVGIGKYLGIPEASIAQFFSDLGKVIVAFETLGEDFTRKFLRHTRQFAERISDAVGLIPDITSGIVGLVDIKPIPVGALDIWEDSLRQVTTRIGQIAENFDKYTAKLIGFFAQQIGPAVTLWKDSIDAIRAMVDLPMPTAQSFVNLFEGIKQALDGFSGLATSLSTDALVKAQSIAEMSMSIFAAIKSAVESFTALRDYKAIAQESIDAILSDFKRAIILLNLLLLDAIEFESKAKTFDGIVTSGAAFLTHGMTTFVGAFTDMAAKLLQLPSGGTSITPGPGFGSVGGMSTQGLSARSMSAQSVTYINIGDLNIPADSTAGKLIKKLVDELAGIATGGMQRDPLLA